MNETALTIHQKFMRIALEQAGEALMLKEFPVGVVFVHKRQVIASGKREHSQDQTGVVNEMDHAEILALRNLPDHDIKRDEIVVYSTMEPCLMCYSTLILNGIRHIVYAYEDVMGGGTNLSLQHLSPLYQEMEIEIIPHILRRQSLLLFKSFFSDKTNNYWKDSLLAHYTFNCEV